jgi:hypothetical protein
LGQLLFLLQGHQAVLRVPLNPLETYRPETCHLLMADTARHKTQTLALVVEQARVLNLL